MEFEEMKKIWDTQSNEALYVINEQALHNRILSKKKNVGRRANYNELLLLATNGGAGVFVFVLGWLKPGGNLFLYLMAMWMLLTMVYMLRSRVRRRRDETKFDRTLLGDLEHAIATATHLVRVSQLMRWNSLALLIMLLASIWENGKGVMLAVFVLTFFSLAYFLSGWEHTIYVSKKKELEGLHKKLDEAC